MTLDLVIPSGLRIRNAKTDSMCETGSKIILECQMHFFSQSFNHWLNIITSSCTRASISSQTQTLTTHCCCRADRPELSGKEAQRPLRWRSSRSQIVSPSPCPSVLACGWRGKQTRQDQARRGMPSRLDDANTKNLPRWTKWMVCDDDRTYFERLPHKLEINSDSPTWPNLSS